MKKEEIRALVEEMLNEGAEDTEERAADTEADALDSIIEDKISRDATERKEETVTRKPDLLDGDATKQAAGDALDHLMRYDAVITFDPRMSKEYRAARYIRAMIRLESESAEVRRDGARILRGVRDQFMKVNERQASLEYAEAAEIVRTSDLDALAKRRVMTLLRNVEHQNYKVRTHNTGTGSEGGYLLPSPLMAEIFVLVEMYGYARSIMRNITMTTKTLDFNEVATKPVAYWAAELANLTASDAAFGRGQMVTGKLTGLSSMSTEVEEDSIVAMLPLLIQLFAEQIAKKEDQAAFYGDGTPTHGGQTGVLALAGATGFPLAAGKTSAADIDVDDLRDISYAISKARRSGASWLLSETTVKSLLKTKDSTGRYIVADPTDPNSIVRLCGYPLVDPAGVDDELLFAADGVSTPVAAFGNFQNSLFGQRRAFQVETSRSAVFDDGAGNVTFNAWQQDAIALRITERVAVGHPIESAYCVVTTAAA